MTLSFSEVDRLKLMDFLWITIHRHQWHRLFCPSTIAFHTGLPICTLQRLFLHPQALMVFLLTPLFESLTLHQGQSPQDTLFDWIMQAIDALQSKRSGLLALYFFQNRKIVHTLPRILSTRFQTQGYLEKAPLRLRYCYQKYFLLGDSPFVSLLKNTIEVWRGDETLDLSVTMGFLNEALDAFAVGSIPMK